MKDLHANVFPVVAADCRSATFETAPFDLSGTPPTPDSITDCASLRKRRATLLQLVPHLSLSASPVPLRGQVELSLPAAHCAGRYSEISGPSCSYPSAGACEIRVHTQLDHRVLCVAKFEEAAYVLRAFEKRNRKTLRATLPYPGSGSLSSDRSAQDRGSHETRIRRSGNVFRDLGSLPEEAENLRLRADLMIQMAKLLQTRRLTQADAAKLLGVTSR